MREIHVATWYGPSGSDRDHHTVAIEDYAEFRNLIDWLSTHDCSLVRTYRYPLEHFKDGSFYRELDLSDVVKKFPGALQGGADQFFNRWHPSGRWDKGAREFWESGDGDPLYQFFEQDGVLRAESLAPNHNNATNAVLAQTMYWLPERKLWYAMNRDKKVDPETHKEIE